MRPRSGEAPELCCPRCGSSEIACERDAILLAGVAGLCDGVLSLSGPAVAEPLDDARLLCLKCDTPLEDVEWTEERSRHLPHGTPPLSDAQALDALSAKLNERGDWNGGDVCELLAGLLQRTGRPLGDEPSQ